MAGKTNTLTDAKRRLLELLKRTGPATASTMAQALGLTNVAIRQHLQVLVQKDLVSPERQPPRGRGRPSILWGLTDNAEKIFPDRHGELTVGLIEAAREAFGAEGLERLLQIRAREQVACYLHLLPGKGAPLKERVEALAAERDDEGYMAEAVEEPGGRFLLIEHHCPICEAARECIGLCNAELDVFRRSLGQGVRVERIRHLLREGDRCTYRIEKASNPPCRAEGFREDGLRGGSG